MRWALLSPLDVGGTGGGKGPVQGHCSYGWNLCSKPIQVPCVYVYRYIYLGKIVKV